jgi:putative oxygen-independent coproporphyrinogen III oxidase
MDVVARAPREVRSVYVHAPFCARRCVYCDFAVTVRKTGDLPAWLEALEREVAIVRAEGLFRLSDRLDTLYVGGGTPSLLGAGAMAGLAELLGAERLSAPGLEWTAEANPESLTPAVAMAWAEAGVNRISLGAQTFHEGGLRWMGRLHGVDGPFHAVSAAREAGIDNISVDLMFGLPTHLGRSWSDDLERVLSLDVPHVSLYGLTVESATPLGRAVREERERPVDEDQYGREYLMAAAMLTEAGYAHYEVSNFARPGAEARHNAAYWQDVPYLGLGNGAHSFAAPVRRWNVRDWEDYGRRLAAGRSPEVEREILDDDAIALERAWLGLRTASGIRAPVAGSAQAGVTSTWVDRGLATIAHPGAGTEGQEGQEGHRGQESQADRVRLTVEGWLLLDELVVEFDAVRGMGP